MGNNTIKYIYMLANLFNQFGRHFLRKPLGTLILKQKEMIFFISLFIKTLRILSKKFSKKNLN